MSAPISSSRLPAAWLSPASAARPGPWAGVLRCILRTVRTRQQLAALDERLLRDIGMSPGDALAEVNRLPWDVVSRRG
ncbi:DUF1127 domain-containing protein [Pseudoroseomonas globiformis]|uniref:DUF1127 domain-containing protein n=1 Tax=Teichococcus globiformis TaxID=2307229 RepID=A0ABV7G176_9PROT